MSQPHHKIASAALELKCLSQQDFLSFGVRHLAYVKPVRLADRNAFVVHAADGTPLSVMDSMDMALGAILHNDLEPVTVH